MQNKQYYHVEADKRGLSEAEKSNFNCYSPRLDSFTSLDEAIKYIYGNCLGDSCYEGFGIFTSLYNYDNSMPNELTDTLTFVEYIENKEVESTITVYTKTEDDREIEDNGSYYLKGSTL